ncbi:crossover junction endodeoxyribonuclease RuvC [bacterium (candidate division B38) B3_B38]|nr:MAG: crossover junction endodeoxyribonuclease RuvC [bacterium (candidate division B38) B3_B38]
MRILGVDPGSRATGYGLIEKEGERLLFIACGVIQPPQNSPFPIILKELYQKLQQLIQLHQPEVIVLEDLFYSRNVRIALNLGHIRGVLMVAAINSGLPVAEYTPLEVKKAVVGYGRADKYQVQQMVKHLLGLSTLPQPYDASDALAVAICHAHCLWK